METWNVEDDTTALEHENARAEKEKKRGTRGEKSGKGKREEDDEERGREWTVNECVGWEEIEKMVKKHTARTRVRTLYCGCANSRKRSTRVLRWDTYTME